MGYCRSGKKGVEWRVPKNNQAGPTWQLPTKRRRAEVATHDRQTLPSVGSNNPQKETKMALFITYASYSQSGVKGLVDKPSDRSGVIKALVEKAGGSSSRFI